MARNYPFWWKEVPISGDHPSRQEPWQAWNRTGGALVAGGIYQFDTFRSLAAAEGAANSKGITLPAVTTDLINDDASCWRNIVAVGQKSSGSTVDPTIQGGFFCVAVSATPDNELADLIVVGAVTLSVIAGASVVSPPMAPFVATAAQTYGTIPTYSTNISKYIGYVREQRTEAGSPAATAVSAFFCGWGLLR